jgi:dienelactone hydrolase
MKRHIIFITIIVMFSCSNVKTQESQEHSKTELAAAKANDEIHGKFMYSSLKLNYLLTFPKNYKEKGAPVPLIVFMHGGGERGDKIELLKRHGPPMMVANGEELPFAVLSPQCPRGLRWTHLLVQVKEMIDEIANTYNIDKQRIYLTGVSLGGYGSWNLAMTYPNDFAAIAPMACNGGMIDEAWRLIDLPIWAFQGEKDGFELHQIMIDKVKKKSRTDVRYTMYLDTDHEGTWVQAYKNPELYKWFLSHKRKERLDIEAIAEKSEERCDFAGTWEVEMIGTSSADKKWEVIISEKQGKIFVNFGEMNMEAKQENCKLSFNLKFPSNRYDKTDVFLTLYNEKLYGIYPTSEGDADIIGEKIE